MNLGGDCERRGRMSGTHGWQRARGGEESELTSLAMVRQLEGQAWKNSREAVDMDWLDSDLLERSDEMCSGGGSCDDGSHLSRQLAYLGAIDETDLASN